MSVATEFAPAVHIPERARSPRPEPSSQRLASVTRLYPPAPHSVAAPVRLTRRGVVALAVLVAAVAVALVGVARLSAPVPAQGAAPSRVPATVIVHPGDTLWSIAAKLAPQRDPRAEVAELQRLNDLSVPGLVPGQVLRTR
jgi:LysM repeat protein